MEESLPFNRDSFQIVDDRTAINDSYTIYLQDESRFKGYADRIAFPLSEADVLELVRNSLKNNQTLTVSSARTGIAGGAVPQGGTLVSLERMDNILNVKWDEKETCWNLLCQPGISLERLDHILRGQESPKGNAELLNSKFWNESRKWFYPPDPTEKTAHLGGTVATNASGSRSYHFGPTRNFVTGLHIVLYNCRLLQLKRGDIILQTGDTVLIEGPDGDLEFSLPDFQMPNVKHAAGYFLKSPMDLIDLFIGSEGTLGIITEIEISLKPRPESMLGILAFFKKDEAALRFVQSLKSSTFEGIFPTAIEYFDLNALQLLQAVKATAQISGIRSFSESAEAAIYVEQDSTEKEGENCMLAYDTLLTEWDTEIIDTWAGTDEHELESMSQFRHAVPEAINTRIGQRQRDIPELHKIGTDFAVPDQDFSKMMTMYRKVLQKAKIEYIIFGHIGDNHVHVNMIPRDKNELKIIKELYVEFAENAVKKGGTVSAEHGIGKLKKHVLCVLYSQEEIEKLQVIKNSLDPNGLFSPGNLF